MGDQGVIGVVVSVVGLLGYVAYRMLVVGKNGRKVWVDSRTDLRQPTGSSLTSRVDSEHGRLLELRAWFDQGVITKEEYDALRDGIVGGL